MRILGRENSKSKVSEVGACFSFSRKNKDSGVPEKNEEERRQEVTTLPGSIGHCSDSAICRA